MSFLDGLFESGPLDVAAQQLTADAIIDPGILHLVRTTTYADSVTLVIRSGQHAGKSIGVKSLSNVIGEPGPGVITVMPPGSVLIENDAGELGASATLSNESGQYREWLCSASGHAWFLVGGAAGGGGGGDDLEPRVEVLENEVLVLDARIDAIEGAPPGDGAGDPFVKARVYLTAAQSTTPGGSWIKLLLDTVDYDTAGIWNAVNKNFRPITPGYYLVNIRARVAASMALVCGIGKNGTQVKAVGLDGTAFANGGSALIYVNGTTDTLDARVFPGTGGQAFTVGSFDTYMEVLGPFNNVGVQSPMADAPTAFSFVAGAVTLDATLARNWVAATLLTANSTITIVNGYDGAHGTIQVKQDATGYRTLAFVIAGRTVLRDLNVGDTNPLGAPNGVTEYHYYFSTIGGTPHVRIYKVFIWA